MTHILKEEKYPNGSLKSRETELHGQQVILKEGWYPPQVDPLNPWQATDAAQQRSGQQRYKFNYVNGRQHGIQEGWYRNGQQEYKENYVNGQKHGLREYWYENGQQQFKLNYVNGQKHGVQEYWYPSGVNPEYPNGRQQDNKYYLDGAEVSQQTYQSYIRGLAPGVQAAADFGERGLSGIIASYLLP